MKQGVQNMAVTVVSIEHDAEVGDEMKQLPEQVKKLVDRNKPKEEEKQKRKRPASRSRSSFKKATPETR